MLAALVRHGEYHQRSDTPSAHQPYPLTDDGRRRAAEAARRFVGWLAGRGWRVAPVIHASNLLRAWQTAEIFAGALAAAGLETRIDAYDELAERSVGAAANLSLAQIADVIAADPRCLPLPPGWKSDSDFRLPLTGAESLRQAGARVALHLRATMDALRASAPSEDTLQLFVGHGAAFRHAAADLGALPREEVGRVSMHHARPVILECRGAAGWRRVSGEWKARGAERSPD
nr:histidine phosphatase family protein [Parahaliea mediterranea]